MSEEYMDDIENDTETKTKRTRAARDTETRDLAERPRTWAPAAILPTPERQHGYVYRWVRVSTLKYGADPINLSAKLREGWEQVRREEQPHLAQLVERNSHFDDGIEIAGLLLCKAPTELMQQRTEYFQRMTKAQMESVDNNLMRQSDPRMPLFRERQSKVSFGSGG